MAALTTLTGVIGEQQQANQEKGYNEALRAANEAQRQLTIKTATQSYVAQADAENTRLAQEDAAASAEAHDARVRGARAAAEARVDAQSAGVTGLSMGALFDDFNRQTLRYTDAVQRARDDDLVAAGIRKAGFKREAENRIASHDAFIPRPVSEPSLFGSALKIGGSAASSYFAYSKYNPRGGSASKTA